MVIVFLLRALVKRRSVFVRLSMLAILLLPAASTTPAYSQANCQATQYHFTFYNGETIGGDSYDPSGFFEYGEVAASWDFEAGTFFCDVSAGEAELSTTAKYTVGNLPAGTPVVVRARFWVTGDLYGCIACYRWNSAEISGPGPNGTWTGSGIMGPVPPIEMLFEGLSDQTFDVGCHFSTVASPVLQAYAGATLRGTLEFYDIPAGAVILPCQAPSVSVPQDQEALFALQPPSPNPTRHSFVVSLTLPTDEPSTLTLYDIGGRLVGKMDLRGYGPGRHTVRLAEREPLPAGVYLIQLVQGARMASVREVVLR